MKERVSKSVILTVIVGIAIAGLILRQVLTRQRQPTVGSVESEEAQGVSNDTLAKTTTLDTQATILSDVVPLPLSAILVGEENGMWLSDDGFRSMPHGTQSFGGIEFHFEGQIQMQGGESEASHLKYRNRITLPLAQAGVTNARVGCLHIVGGSRFGSDLRAEVAEVVWRYSDGSKARAQLAYDEQIRDWNHVPYEEPAHLPYPFTKTIWRAEKPKPAGRWLRLYRVSLGNPEPEKAVRDIELTSGRGAASLFVVAATLDPLQPGARPDDSPDLEPTDTNPPRYIDILVTSSEGQAVPKANVKMQWRVKNERGIAATKQAITDEAGAVRITYPPDNLSTLEITASHENFASRKMVWNLAGGDAVPANYQIKLTAGISIGGFVVDSGDAPVPDAKLSFHRFWSGGDMSEKGDQSEFSSRTITSDSQGAWQLKDLPVDLLANINLNVEHPDFRQMNLTIGSTVAQLTKLREGTFKIVLSRGVELRGIVVDENGNPIADATVWTGRRSFPDRHQTNSDSDGQFAFQGVGEGDTLISAMAKGRKPASKTIKVQSRMDAVTLKLGPGTVIKGIVQNSAGEPISDVQISLENNGPNDFGYEYSTTSGADGRFMWDGAPDDFLQFNFAKGGFARKRGVQLKANEDNVVTLHKPREVQGVVIDMESSQPITKFQVLAGQSHDPDYFWGDSNAKKEIADVNGQFTFSLEEEEKNGVQVRAEDYADQVQEVPKDKEGVIRLEFKMKRSSALQGIVVGPDGSPIPGAQVALTKEGFAGPMTVHWREGKFENYGSGPQIVTTDSSGKFTLNSPPESEGLVVALGEIGFGSSTVEQVRSGGILMLLPFGQIEGVLKIGGQPAAGKEILFSLQNVGVMTDFQKLKVETDDDGKFKFERLPAGEGQLVRLIKTSPNSWMHSYNTPVKVEPGQTTFVTLGDSGAVVRGRARLESPPEDGESLTISGSLTTAMNQPSFSSGALAQAYFRSPEGRAQMKLQKHFAIVVDADGSFVVDSVPPGSYSLMLSASRGGTGFGPRPGMPMMTQSLPVTVSDNPDPMSPIDVGEIVLTNPTPKPAPAK